MEALSNWLARLTVNQVSSEHVGSIPTASTKYRSSKARAPDCLSGRYGFESRRYCKTEKITVVVYPLWKREVASSNLASQTKCSISIVASASDFLSEDKGSIPLWSTKWGITQLVEYRAFNTGVLGSSPNASTICRDGQNGKGAWLRIRYLRVRISLPVRCPTSPIGRGKGLKILKVQVRILGGVQYKLMV